MSSGATTGLIIGKFMPPTLGHQYLLDFGRAYVDRLTVLVCSLAREPIPGKLRHGWVTELCPRAEVHHLTDELPQEPEEHPRFWELWTAAVRRFLPKGPDVVFTSEAYGWRLAEALGARHVPVDPSRAQVPVSGTAVRAAPLEHWRFLPACVRPHFVKRVVVLGPESTGKTTLCARLAAHYGTVWAPEWARPYLDAKASPLAEDDLEVIARGHAAAEDALARQAQRVLFVDTDATTTALYSEIYYGRVSPAVAELARTRSHDLYLLTAPDVPWVEDRQRDLPHRRDEVMARLDAGLRRHDRRVEVLRGGWDERFHRATSLVDSLLI